LYHNAAAALGDGTPSPTAVRVAAHTEAVSWYIEIELFGRVIHEVAVSQNELEAKRCYERARAQWRSGQAVALELDDTTRLGSYFAEDVTGLRLLGEDQALAA
jgi:hypothetical protein